MKKEYDFSKAKKRDPSRIDPNPKIMISLRLDAMVVARLKDEADELGIGYQTLINNILRKHTDPTEDNLEERILKRILAKLEKRPKKKKSA